MCPGEDGSTDIQGEEKKELRSTGHSEVWVSLGMLPKKLTVPTNMASRGPYSKHFYHSEHCPEEYRNFHVKNKEAAEELSLLPPSSHNKKWLREKEGENWYCVVPGNRVRVRVGKSERTDFSIPILRCNLYLDLSSRGMNGLMNSMALEFPWGTTDVLLCWRVKLAPISGSWC